MKTPAHYRAAPKTLSRAKSLRKNMTDEEHSLWSSLRAFRSQGFAFRKQAAIGSFIADFLCRKAKLVVELDGRHHDDPMQMKHDQSRDEWLVLEGYTVIRFAAHEVRDDLDDVIEAIEAALNILKDVGYGVAMTLEK